MRAWLAVLLGLLVRAVLRLSPLIVLAFPFVDLFSAFAAVAAWDWAAFGWLLGAALLGFVLLRRERTQVGARLQAVMHVVRARAGAGRGSASPIIREMLRAAGTFLAALLLIFPGLVSDVLAAGILLFAWFAAPKVLTPANDERFTPDGAIQGDYKVVNEPRTPLPDASPRDRS